MEMDAPLTRENPMSYHARVKEEGSLTE